MKEHEHTTKNKPETKPAQDQAANKANAEGTTPHAGSDHAGHHDHQDHHAHMAADFRNRFWISLALTVPILLLSPLLQRLVGLREAIHFSGDLDVLFGFASAVFWYGGWPFLKGLFKELKSRQPGMMTLVAVAITTNVILGSSQPPPPSGRSS